MTHSIQYYEQAFRTLHTNMQHGKPAPHKAFLLLAVIDDELFALLQDETVRARLRVVLISTYLTDQPVKVSIIDGADKTGLVLISLLLGMMVA